MQSATSSAAQDNLVLTVSSSAELSAALATLQDTGGTMKRSRETGQLPKVYSRPSKGYGHGETPELCRAV